MSDLLRHLRGRFRTLPGDFDPEEMANVTGYREEGYRRFQLKVGGDPDADIERIRQVAAVLQPGDKFIADANPVLKHEAMLSWAGQRPRRLYRRPAGATRIVCPCPAHRPALRNGRIDRRNP